MKNIYKILLLLILGLFQISCNDQPKSQVALQQKKGEEFYKNTCSLCHGLNGEGYAADNAPALANQQFLSTVTNNFLFQTIKLGRPGTNMSAWGKADGGPYSDEDIEAIITFVRSWKLDPKVQGQEAENSRPVQGDVELGSEVYENTCANCHGTNGVEGIYTDLGNPNFLVVAGDEFIREAIKHGRKGTPMQAFENKLSAEEIDGLVALIRSWQNPVAKRISVLPSDQRPLVIDPSEPQPNFPLGQRFSKIDTVKRELDSGKSIVFVDARAPSDYVAEHIKGAVNIPFYEVKKHLDLLPRDSWIVTYCACPHAEAERAADDLLKNGFRKVTVLDEGFLQWRDRGFPVHRGAEPQ